MCTNPFRRVVLGMVLSAIILIAGVLPGVAGTLPATQQTSKDSVGTGDGRIHVIPTLSSHSVKNGQKLTVTAVVQAKAGIKEVVADLAGEKVTLKPSANIGGKNTDSTLGAYTAEWTARNLKETIYPVAIRVTDRNGHVYTDRSTQFSDPADGNASVGTTGYPSDAVKRVASIPASSGSNQFTCALLDATNRFVYFGTNTSPGRIVKFGLPGAQGGTITTPQEIGYIQLTKNIVNCGVIDAGGTYAYFSTTGATPCTLVRVNLTTFLEQGTVPFGAGETAANAAAIDTTRGYAYFATNASPSIVVKFKLSTFARVGAASLATNENNARTVLMDSSRGADGTLYVVTWSATTGTSLVKVNCGNGDTAPSRVGAVNITGVGSASPPLNNSTIDAANGFAYVQANTNYLSKIDLNTFSLVGTVACNGNAAAVLDPNGIYGYSGSNAAPGVMWKIAMNPGQTPSNNLYLPQVCGGVPLMPNENNIYCSVFDPQTNSIFLGTYTTPGRVIQMQVPPADGLSRQSALTCAGDSNFKTAVVDAAKGYAYFGTDTVPGKVVKVSLGAGSSAPVKIGTLTLASGEDNLHSSIIDTAHGYAYFGTGTSPGKVVKVALGSGSALPTRVGALALQPGEDDLACAVIDSWGIYGYFGTNASPATVVKVMLGSGATVPSRSDAAVLPPTITNFTCAVIDGSYGYFGTSTTPGAIAKIDLGGLATTLTYTSSLVLNAGENNLVSAGVDINGFGYFGAGTTPGQIIRVSLNSATTDSPARMAALPAGGSNVNCLTMSGVSRNLCYGTGNSPALVGKADLAGQQSYPPVSTVQTRTGLISLNAGENGAASVVTDSTGFAYFGTNTSPAMVVKVAITPPSDAPARIGAVTLNGEAWFKSGCIDTVNGYAYFGTDINSGRIVKVKLNGLNPPAQTGALDLAADEIKLSAAVADSTNGYGYFCTYTSPAKIVKIKFNGTDQPTTVGTLELAAGEDMVTCAALNPAGTVLYVATDTSPATIVKLDVSGGDVAPARISAVPLNANENNARSLFYDSANDQVVVVAKNAASSPAGMAAIVKLNASTLARISGLDDNAAGFSSAVAGPAVFDSASYAVYLPQQFVGTGTMFKYNLNTALAAPTRVGSGQLNISPQSEAGFSAGLFDPADGCSYYLQSSNPASVVKVSSQGAVTAASARVGGLQLALGENGANSLGSVGGVLLQDPATGVLYVGTYSYPARIVQVAPSLRNAIRATKISVAADSALTDVHFYSHKNTGNVRLAIYDNSATKRLLWQSASVANTASNGWLTVPVASGTPSAVALTAGTTYWLAWQTDSPADVASYTAGGAYGDGFTMFQAYGSYPSRIADSGIRYSSDKWSEYVTYNAASVATLQVNSEVDGALPDIGGTPYASGSTVHASVPAVVPGDTGTRYVSLGWTGTGSVPASGTENSVDITLNESSSITWLWKTQYYLTSLVATTAGGSVVLASDNVTPPDGWYDSGASVEVRALPASGYKFGLWSGGASGSSADATVNIDAAKSVTATFLDGTSPTGNITIGNGEDYVSTTSVSLALSANDSGTTTTGVTAMRFSTDNSTWSEWESYAADRSWTLDTSDGATTIYVQYRDGAGNISVGTISDTISLDTTPPSGSVLVNNGDLYAGSTGVTLTLSGTDTGSGMDEMRISNDGSTWSEWESFATTKAWTLIGGNGLKTVYVELKDSLGNVSQVTDTITLDSTEPYGTVTINNGSLYTSSTAVGLGLYATGAGLGITDMRFSNDGIDWGAGWEAYATSKDWTLTPADGLKTVYVEYRDSLGSTVQTTDTVTLDTTAPTGTILINSDAVYSTSSVVSLSLTASDNGSGPAKMRFKNEDADWTAWENFAASKAWALSDGDGEKTVNAEFMDTAGNISSASISDAINLDTAAPTGTIIINGDAQYTTVTAVALDLTNDDAGAVQMQFSNNGSTWSNWEAFAATKSWQLTTGPDGVRSVFVRYKDVAGNISTGSISDAISLVTSAPTGSVTINNGAEISSATAVTLALSASDVGAAVTKMRFSNDNSTWTDWEAYATSKMHTLSDGDGLKTVYARFQNAAGIASSSTSATITLDMTRPSSAVTAPTLDTTIPALKVEWTASDSGVGVASVSIYWNRNGGEFSLLGTYPASKTNTTFDVSEYGGGEYGFYSVATDSAGNTEDVPSVPDVSVTYDTTPNAADSWWSQMQ